MKEHSLNDILVDVIVTPRPTSRSGLQRPVSAMTDAPCIEEYMSEAKLVCNDEERAR